MSVAIIIITHGTIGESILQTATDIIGSVPMPVKTISVGMDCDIETEIKKIDQLAKEMSTGDGILILTDLFGSTPSNIASAIKIPDSVVVAGLNLPMLIRVMNYYILPLYELTDKATGGGKDGILACYLDSQNETNSD